MNQDPIANLVSIILNGYRVGSSRVFIPYSREKERILEVLKKESYVKNLRHLEKDGHKILSVKLLYQKDAPAISMMKRISKPGQRIYCKPAEFKPTLNLAKNNRDLGLQIISTSQGIMSTHEAKKKNIGGELLIKVY